MLHNKTENNFLPGMLSPGLSFLTSCLTPCFSHHITALVISIHRLLFPLYALQLTSPRVQSFVYIWVAHPYLWVSPLSEPGCTGQHFCLKWWNKFAVSTFSKYCAALEAVVKAWCCHSNDIEIWHFYIAYSLYWYYCGQYNMPQPMV